MPNDMLPVLLPMVAADSMQPLPSSVARALRQAEHDDHPDIPWRPPAVLPPTDALDVAIAMLTPEPADDRTISAGLAALMVAFEPNTKLSPEATRLRFTVWREATADLGSALWTLAIQRAIRTLKWMPKPSELRDLVRFELEARDRRRQRCERMRAEQARRTAAPRQPVETREERLTNLVAIYRKHDRPADAERVQRELDELLKRKAVRTNPLRTMP